MCQQGISGLLLIIGAYITVMLTTAGYLRRATPPISNRRVVLGAVLWPAYWLVCVGPVSSLKVIITSISDLLMALLLVLHRALEDKSTFSAYLAVMLMFPALYLYLYWDSAQSWGVVVIKALVWAPFWPAYLVASLV